MLCFCGSYRLSAPIPIASLSSLTLASLMNYCQSSGLSLTPPLSVQRVEKQGMTFCNAMCNEKYQPPGRGFSSLQICWQVPSCNRVYQALYNRSSCTLTKLIILPNCQQLMCFRSRAVLAYVSVCQGAVSPDHNLGVHLWL